MPKQTPSLKLQKYINTNIGEIITSDILKGLCAKKSAGTVKTYFYNLIKHGGFFEKVSYGAYVIKNPINDLNLIRYSPTQLHRKLTKTKDKQEFS